MHIRRCEERDRELYLRLAKEFYHSPAVLHPVPDSYFERTVDEMMRSGDYMQGLIFEADGEIAGYALLCRTYSQEAGGPAVWIDEVYIAPQFRGRGLGHELFRNLRELLPAARYRLEIEPDNARAEKLYRSMGFERLPYAQMVLDLPDGDVPEE